MSDVIPQCVNHPGTETRLSCTSCGDPICPRCMRQAAVGQKCPACARQPRSARARGKPRDYVRLGLAGPVAAAAGGFVYSLVLAWVGFGGLILAAVVGYGMGRTVRWAARGQTQQPFRGIAIGLGVVAIGLGLIFARGTPVPGGLFGLLAYGASGWFAGRALSG
jgi:hypothetical protein